jgi:hypothetical protein
VQLGDYLSDAQLERVANGTATSGALRELLSPETLDRLARVREWKTAAPEPAGPQPEEA